jgi:hypothetical protein
MNESNVVTIHTLSDSLEARLKARQLARKLGFNLQDQAYISLVTWELAVRLGLGISRQGIITISTIGQDQPQGIRVVCDTKDVGPADLKAISSEEIKSLVDELIIRQPNPNGSEVEIAAIKWEK